MIDSCNIKRMQGKVIYELNEDEVLELYYSEPRLAALMNLDVICLIDRHLVVNLRQFITPKTRHLTAYAKKNLPACCVGIQYVYTDKSETTKGLAVRWICLLKRQDLWRAALLLMGSKPKKKLAKNQIR